MDNKYHQCARVRICMFVYIKLNVLSFLYQKQCAQHFLRNFCMTRSIHLFTLRCGIKDVSANVSRIPLFCVPTYCILPMCMCARTQNETDFPFKHVSVQGILDVFLFILKIHLLYPIAWYLSRLFFVSIIQNSLSSSQKV